MANHEFKLNPDCTCENCRKYTPTELWLCGTIGVISIVAILYLTFVGV